MSDDKGPAFALAVEALILRIDLRALGKWRRFAATASATECGAIAELGI